MGDIANAEIEGAAWAGWWGRDYRWPSLYLGSRLSGGLGVDMVIDSSAQPPLVEPW